jgi:mono/diheme cytochrome c family protein
MSPEARRPSTGPATGGEPAPLPDAVQRADLEPDVERLHRAIAREPRDPHEGREPVPWWVWAGAVLAIFWGGWYLGRYGGTFDTSTHVAVERRDLTTAGEAREQATVAEFDPVRAGQQIFAQRCQSCHQPNGRGLPGAFPPLVGSEWVNGPAETVVHIILDGLQGPVQVAGKSFNGAMPAWRDQLSNQEIAAVVTYIRQWRPNSAPPVDTTLVAPLRAATAQRRRPWTVPELQSARRSTSPAGPGRG